MTNQHLIRNWRSIGIKFKSSKEFTSLSDLFLVCVGETEIDVNGTKERVVTFFEAYDDKGSPAVFFTSDDKDRCWTFAHNDGTHIKSNIGSFIKEMPQRNKKRNRKTKLTSDDTDV
jgi:hypothetical protein